MLAQDYRYFLDNQEEFIRNYTNKFIVLKEKAIIGVYNSNSEAHNETLKNEVAGSFLIQHCVANCFA
jgi:hypothetical protein